MREIRLGSRFAARSRTDRLGWAHSHRATRSLLPCACEPRRTPHGGPRRSRRIDARSSSSPSSRSCSPRRSIATEVVTAASVFGRAEGIRGTGHSPRHCAALSQSTRSQSSSARANAATVTGDDQPLAAMQAVPNATCISNSRRTCCRRGGPNNDPGRRERPALTGSDVCGRCPLSAAVGG